MSPTLHHDPFDPHKWFVKFLILICVILLGIFAFSCDCNYHLRQAKKKCNQSLLSDTIRIQDTIYSKSIQRDTTFYFNQNDTVVIREGKLVMKYFYTDSTVYLKGECLTDTIYRDKFIVTNTTELKPDLFNKYKWWIIGFFAVLLIIAILRK